MNVDENEVTRSLICVHLRLID